MRSVAVVMLSLCGCAPTYQGGTSSIPQPPPRDVEQEMQLTAAECAKKHPTGKDKRPATPYMACFMDADVVYWAGRNSFRHNLALETKAATLAVSEQYDAHKISVERLQAELQLIGSQAQQKLSAAANQYAALQSEQQALQQQQSMALFAAGARMMTPPPAVTCQTWMNTTTCR